MTKNLIIPRVDDFELTGDGAASAWQKAEWQTLVALWGGKAGYRSRVKSVYSDKGIYFLFDCEDRKLTCTIMQDFGKTWEEDVSEVFLQPDEKQNVYFEYQLSPLGYELVLLIPNSGAGFMGWLPWQYEGERHTRTATSVRGGKKASLATVSGWMTEFFIPFTLMKGLANTPPKPGTRWRANFYRIDYDDAPATHWSWSEITEGKSFHKPERFGTLVFGE